MKDATRLVAVVWFAARKCPNFGQGVAPFAYKALLAGRRP